MKKNCKYCAAIVLAFLMLTGCKEATVQDVVSDVSRFCGKIIEKIEEDTSDSVKSVVYSNFDEALSNPEYVYHIAITNSNIDTLPNAIIKCKKLESIDLSNNKFTKFPLELTELKNLNYINLGKNKISVIGDDIYKLTELSILKLHDNKLEKLPDALGYLPNLSKLYLNNNKLKSLPRSIGKLKRLNVLSLAGNKFDDIPDGITELKELKIFDISRCGKNLSRNKIEQLKNSLKSTKIVFSEY